MSAAHGGFVNATVDATGGSVNLQSAGTGSAADYPVSVTVTDTTPAQDQAYFPYPGFDFDASSTTGGSSGAADATYGLVYSYYVPLGGYAANGNLLAHSDSVMGDWLFDYDTLNRRIETTAAGVKDGTYQSLPFGDNEVTTGHDATENHFTGKEHDGESGNDYFAARYYNSSVGRWMSPDWVPRPSRTRKWMTRSR